MIRSVDIRNFRGFKHLHIDNCQRVNVIVGDNGVGKTALLEAIFLALGGNPELGARYHAQRGLDSSFNAPPRRIEEALWRDLFYKLDWSHPIDIRLEGDGPESRSVSVFRGEPSQLTIPLEVTAKEAEAGVRAAPIVFVWRDVEGREHRRVPKLIPPSGLQVEGDQEDLPDFFYVSASQTIGSGENAGRFSDLSREGRAQTFVDLVKNEYEWVDALNIEVVAGAPVIFATSRDTHQKLPLALISGGVNRIVGIMLTLAAREKAVVLVDEIENGVYHKHHTAIWRVILSLCRGYQAQLFATTHSEEWIEAGFEAAGDDLSDIALWRIERLDKGLALRQFSGKQTAAAVRVGEVR